MGQCDTDEVYTWVRSYDYGSVGKINARACIGADPRNPERKLYVTNDCMIPKYSQQTPYIAEAQLDESGWEEFTGGPGADTETGPGNNMNSGDGLTAFEEYRGFVITGGSSQRLSPLKRDVFWIGTLVHDHDCRRELLFPTGQQKMSIDVKRFLKSSEAKLLLSKNPGNPLIL